MIRLLRTGDADVYNATEAVAFLLFVVVLALIADAWFQVRERRKQGGSRYTGRGR
jgi:membrane protein implicated in regulation of membrane protease activity